MEYEIRDKTYQMRLKVMINGHWHFFSKKACDELKDILEKVD